MRTAIFASLLKVNSSLINQEHEKKELQSQMALLEAMTLHAQQLQGKTTA